MSNRLKGRHKKKESICSVCGSFFNYLSDGMICAYMLLIIVLMPFYNQEGFAHIGTDKAMFFRQISIYGAILILPVVVMKVVFLAIERKEKKGKKQTFLSMTDLFALIYGGSLILSYLFSDYKEQALWGADGWYMGLLPQIALLAIYFLVSRCWIKRNWIVQLFLPVSAIVFALGYLNRFGIFPIDMKIDNASFLSTIGNINWYCGYLVSVMFGGYYLLWQSVGKKVTKREALLMAYVAIGFATLVTQGSQSGIFALAVMMIVTFCLSAESGTKMQMFWLGTTILSFVCVVTLCVRTIFHGQITFEDAIVDLLTFSAFPVIAAVFSVGIFLWLRYCNARNAYPVKLFRVLKYLVSGGSVACVSLFVLLIAMNTIRPGSIGSLSDSSFFTFAPAWGSNRGATWQAGLMCFAEQNFLHKLIGVGPDCMSGFLYDKGSQELLGLVVERFGNSALTNAHCEWLTVLVNEGILGFVGFVGMMVSAIIRYIKQGSKEVIVGACGFCLLAYTVNNMFSFQQSMSVATIFVILGIGEAYARSMRLCCL